MLLCMLFIEEIDIHVAPIILIIYGGYMIIRDVRKIWIDFTKTTYCGIIVVERKELVDLYIYINMVQMI